MLEKIIKKDDFTIKDAVQAIDLGRGYGGDVFIGGHNTVEKFKIFEKPLKDYCIAIKNNDVYAHKNRYVSIGLIDPVINWMAYNPKTQAKNLEEMIEKNIGRDIAVQNKAYYPNTYFGVWWGALIGFLAPLIVQIMCHAYTKRDAEEGDAGFGALNAGVGLAFDFVHPSVFFIRTGAPVVWNVLMGNR
ncbi:hypothetical protein HY837_03305 [archaeon]|nr:hypothetical protein [archaeon]